MCLSMRGVPALESQNPSPTSPLDYLLTEEESDRVELAARNEPETVILALVWFILAFREWAHDRTAPDPAEGEFL
jgi:hypothetical protein